MRYYEGTHITGVASSTTYGDTFVSTEEEQKTVKAVMLSVSNHDDGNYVVIKIDREEIVRIPINLLPVFDGSGGTNTFQTASQVKMLDIDRALEVGEEFKVGIECDATNIDLVYAIQYEIA